ncbi:MAG: MBL fold metallo-hydrolase [Caldilineaceae bacterium]|nr:MBL fold metallo-hydrolase [Caldilineaceae bacterium]
MKKVHPIGRRSFLMNTGRGMVGLWSELSFGLGSKMLAIAIGGSGLATACTQPLIVAPEATAVSDIDPVEYVRVIADFVNAYVLIRGNEVALVDTGIPGTGDQFASVLSDAGLGWDAVNHLILTHYHGDHVGAMGEVMEAASGATIYAGAEDIPQIETPHSIQAVADGDEVFGLQIIGTPGHTLGHISVLDPVGALLVAGDALTNAEGTLSGSNPQFTADMALANDSVRKLATFPFDTAVFGHGEPLEGNASDAVAALAETLE